MNSTLLILSTIQSLAAASFKEILQTMACMIKKRSAEHAFSQNDEYMRNMFKPAKTICFNRKFGPTIVNPNPISESNMFTSSNQLSTQTNSSNSSNQVSSTTHASCERCQTNADATLRLQEELAHMKQTCNQLLGQLHQMNRQLEHVRANNCSDVQEKDSYFV